MRKTLILAALVAPVALTACATSQYQNDPKYDMGYADGCETGTARSQGAPPSKPVRDEIEWKSSDAYKAGWKAGFNTCNTSGSRDTVGTDRDPTNRY